MNEAESKPMCILKHGSDKGSHLFKVTKATVKKIWELTPHLLKLPVKTIDLENINFFFGLVSSTGMLQIWDLRKRRPIFSVDLQMTLYWAEVFPSQEELPIFIVSSRLLGSLFLYKWNKQSPASEEGDPPVHPFIPIRLRQQANTFNKPVLWKDKSVAVVCNSDIVQILQLPPAEAVAEAAEIKFDSGVTLVKGFKTQADLLLVGTELKDLHLVNYQTSKFLSTLPLAEEIDKNSASNIPTYITSCDGDEDLGLFAVGTSSPYVHVIRIEFGSSDSKVAKLSIQSTVVISPGIGTSHLLLHPNKKLIAVAAWDFSLQIYSFPDMTRIHKCVTDARQGIVSLHFITSTDVDAEEDPEAKRDFDTNQDLVYLAAATPDGCIRVWNLSGW